MDRTPALALLGLLLVLLAIPLALSFGPLIIGAILLAWAARKAHLAVGATDGQPAPGPAAAMPALTPSA
jgi:apolipoprotein N-acyltransferase